VLRVLPGISHGLAMGVSREMHWSFTSGNPRTLFGGLRGIGIKSKSAATTSTDATHHESAERDGRWRRHAAICSASFRWFFAGSGMVCKWSRRWERHDGNDQYDWALHSAGVSAHAERDNDRCIRNSNAIDQNKRCGHSRQSRSADFFSFSDTVPRWSFHADG
jgi:hypothetical protein